MSDSGIYKIESIKDGKIYIGSAISISERFGKHLRSLKNNSHHNIKLQRSWNKNGESNFIFSVVEYHVPIDKLIEREQFYMDVLNPFFNICKKAGSNLGFKHSEETKEFFKNRMIGSQIRKGKPFSKESLQKLSDMRKGKCSEKQLEVSKQNQIKAAQSRIGTHHTEESKNKIKNALLGIKRGPMSEETKKKLSKSNTGKSRGIGRIASEETKKKLSKSKMGNLSRLGQTQSEETKRIISERIKEWHRKRKEKIKDIIENNSF